MMRRQPTSLTAKGWLLLFATLCVTAFWWNNFRGFFTSPADFAKASGTISQSFLSYSGGKSAGYNHNIRYSYSVNGQSYTSGQVNFRFWGDKSMSAAQGYIQKYPAGQPVTVWYLPGKPAFSVLEPNDKYGTDKMLLIMGTMYLAAIACIVAGGVAKRRMEGG